MCQKLVDVTEVLKHDIKLSYHCVAIIRRVLPVTLTDNVVQCVILSLEIDLKIFFSVSENLNFRNLAKLPQFYKRQASMLEASLNK